MIKSAAVFYFSGTGNTEFVSRLVERELLANRLAAHRQPIETVAVPNLDDHDAVFLGFPVHGYGVPVLVRKFIERIPRNLPKAAVVFATFGGWSCGALQWAARLLKDRGLRVIAMLGVKMPHNNPPGVDMARQPVAQLAKKARDSVTAAIPRIIRSSDEIEMCSISGTLVGSWVNPLFVENGWMDFSFSRYAFANERCEHCMLCVRICPTQSISVESTGLRFGTGCSSCLRCFNQCPTGAIQVRTGAREVPQYRGPLGDYRCPVVKR